MSGSLGGEAGIARVATAFLDCTLPKAEWTHAAHFATTLWLIRRDGVERVREDLPDRIRRYNESVGGVNDDSAGYHHTITLASIAAADAELARHPADRPLVAILSALLASPLGHPAWLERHYSRERLFAVAARHGWAEPDLVPLPGERAHNG